MKLNLPPGLTPDQRRAQAQGLKSSTLLSAIFQAREREILDSWKTAETTEKRESCHADLRALDELRELLLVAVDQELA